MAPWWKKDKESAPAAPAATGPDPVFAFLTAAQGVYLRTLVGAALEGQGLGATVHGDHAVDSNGYQYGLANLAAVCAGHPDGEAAWPDLVGSHIATMVAAVSKGDPLEGLSDDEFLRSVYARLIDTTGIAPLDFAEDFGYARRLTDQVAAILVLDRPETVVFLTTAMLAGRDVDSLWSTGLAHLTQEPLGTYSTFREPRMDGVIHLLEGESVFTSAKVLRMEWVLGQTTPEATAPDGVIVAFPHRHLLLWHVLEDAAAIPSVTTVATIAAAQYRTGISPISPNVFWWHGGRLTEISHIDDAGALAIVPGEELTAVLNRVAGA